MSLSNKANQVLEHAIVENAIVVDISATDDDLSSPSILYIGTGGDIKVDTLGGQTVTYYNYGDGRFLPVFVTKVYKVGTTADNILAHR